MNELSLSPAERARNAHAAILAAVQAPGSGVAISAALGASEATVSRIKNERLSDVLAFLYAAGFKVVPQNVVAVDAERLGLVLTAAHRTLSDKEALRSFVMEEA